MDHSFTHKIIEILRRHFGENAEQIFNNSKLLQYLNLKTVSANKGSKSRSSFGNLYAIYVLTEDYVSKNFHSNKNYSKYEGAKFSDLLKRQRELPFGSKLQNHSLNHRLNEEFKKFFPTNKYIPILRDLETKRYWINEKLLKVRANNHIFNIAEAVMEIIDEYIKVKKNSFDHFIKISEQLQAVEHHYPQKIKDFVLSLLEPQVDARLFEIVSYAILKYDYIQQSIFWGYSPDSLEQDFLKLYKTGRTNANDGGIDFVMKPLGRFFQVTETTDVKKFFLDIDKLEKYPVTFVIKSTKSVEHLKEIIRKGAEDQYGIDSIVSKYMESIEEIININRLKKSLDKIEKEGHLGNVLSEIVKQSKVEFNYD